MSRLLKANPELLEEYVKRNASKKTLEQVTSIVHGPSVKWYLKSFSQWTEKRSEKLKKPTKLTRGKSNLSSWKVVKNILHLGHIHLILTMLLQVLLRPWQAWSAGGDDQSSWGLIHEANGQRPGCVIEQLMNLVHLLHKIKWQII